MPTVANKRMKDAIRGSIANPLAANAIIDLIDKFNALQAQLDTDLAKVNATHAKLDLDAGVTDTNYAATNDITADYETSNDVDSSI